MHIKLIKAIQLYLMYNNNYNFIDFKFSKKKKNICHMKYVKKKIIIILEQNEFSYQYSNEFSNFMIFYIKLILQYLYHVYI